MKVFDFRGSNFRTENNILQIFDDFQVTEAFEDNHVEQAIIVHGMFKKRKRSAVEPAITDQDKRTFVDRGVFGFDHQTRRTTSRDLRRRDKITDRPEIAPQSIAGLFDNLRVQAHAAELDKELSVRERKIDQPRAVSLNDAPTGIQIVCRETNFIGKDIHRPHRKNAQCRFAVCNSVNDFVNRAIAARSDNFAIPFFRRAPGARFGFADARGCVNKRNPGQLLDLRPPALRALASRGRIQDHKSIVHRQKAAFIFASNSLRSAVRKFGRLILFGLTGLLILAAVVLLGMNLYVQSQGTQARIQRELRRHFGADLHIGRISVTPWGGLKLSGITIPQSDQPDAANFLEAQSFNLQLRFLSLFSRKLVITEVALVDPKVIWQQNEQGKWRLPSRTEKESPPARESALPEPELPAFTPNIELLPSPTPPAETSPAALPPVKERRGEIVTEIRRLNLRNGNFRFLDRSARLVAAFENVGIRSLLSAPDALRGKATVEKISLRDRFFLQQLATPLRYESGELELSQISARIGDGEITGRFSLQSQTEDSPFSVDAKFRNVQADRLIIEASGPAGILQGKLEGSFQATGKTADADALAGTGEILLHDGQLRQYPLLVAVGQILQIDELTQLHLEQAEAKYHIAPGVVTVDQLDLRSQNIHLTATGTINFSGKLHLDSRLSINDQIYNRLFKAIRANFQPGDEPGFYAVDFQVTGTLDRPKTNLLEKAVGGDLKDFLRSIWRGKLDRAKKKKDNVPNDESSSPTPDPSAAASP